MASIMCSYEGMHRHLKKLQEKVVEGSGKSSDRYHLGKLILQSLKEDPEFVVQIDAATDEMETAASVLERSVWCATSFSNLGCGVGDVLVTMAPNHNDLSVAVFAALYLGMTVAAVDKSASVENLQNHLDLRQSKLVICQSDKLVDVQHTLKTIHLDAKIITFDENTTKTVSSFKEMLNHNAGEVTVKDFIASDFDPEETISFLMGTSGTTGRPKAVATTHKNFVSSGPNLWSTYPTNPSPGGITMVVASLDWMSAVLQTLLGAIFRITRLQTSMPPSVEIWHQMINRYRPTYMHLSTPVVSKLIKPPAQEICDFSSLKLVNVGGNAVPPEMLKELKEIMPNAVCLNTYGMTEASGMTLTPESGAPSGSSGKQLPCFEYRLVDMATGNDVSETNKPGELWLRGDGIFKGYYKNEEATKETFAEGGWYKTGDMFYRDDNNFYFFVERIKLMMKTYELVGENIKRTEVSPVEVESVIRRHPGVMDVAVTGIPDAESANLLVACVVPRPGHTVAAQEIKDLVIKTLGYLKRLKGGVIFLEELPVTTTSKLHRTKVQEIACLMDKL